MKLLNKTVLISTLVVLGFNGCASSGNNAQPKDLKITKVFKPYQFKYKPIVGSRQDDSQVLMDQGVVLKAWVNSYKNQYGSLVASHDIYVRVKEPDFITSYAKIPNLRKVRGLLRENHQQTISVAKKELDKSSNETNKKIKKYTETENNNESNKLRKGLKTKEQQIADSEIKRYLQSKK